MARKALEISYVGLTDKNVEQLRKLNTVLFPVRYSDKFYSTDVLKPEHADVSKLVCHNDVAIGAVCCRLEADPAAPNGPKKLYMMVLGVLAPYRGYGIGSKMLQMVVDWVKARSDVSEIYLHVQTNNEDALKFYQKHGFAISSTVDKYYQRIEPASAHILTLAVKK